MADYVAIIRHVLSVSVASFRSITYCVRPVAVSANAPGFAHKPIAVAISPGVGINGGARTTDAAACASSVFASDARRKPFPTRLFAAAVATQT